MLEHEPARCIPDPSRPILVRARWSRPAWCRDDWCLVRLPNGYCYYSSTAVVEFVDTVICWVRAKHLWPQDERRMVHVRFLDYDGEGSLDSVGVGEIREVIGKEGGGT